ncbi:MAG TPA: hypothetical protein PJ991_05890 [Kiritimatiellia bacterium]|nr:hypothetical protein [Kiritimatiellia bacterium]
MKTKQNSLIKMSLGSGIAFALALATWLPGAARAAEHEHGSHDMMQMEHITTQAQAEALKPGDAMSMTCSKCKHVMIQKVGTDNAHVKMMTVGEKMMCPACDGTVEVVATGKGEGKDAEVKHVCSKCGDDAMFCSATKAGSGSMKDMKMGKGMGMGKDKE